MSCRALLFGGMRESREKEVTLTGASVEPFRVLLQYIYTGQMSLVGLKVGFIVMCVWDLTTRFLPLIACWRGTD